MSMTKFVPDTSPSPHQSPPENSASAAVKTNKGFLQRWYRLTAISEVTESAPFAERERVRQSQLTSFVLLFYTVMVVSLVPVCFLVMSIYPTYIWLMLGLVSICIVALVLNSRGFIITAGIIVNIGSFTALTLAIFSTVPLDATTLQAYDMYVVVELLAVSLLPPRSVFIAFLASVASILTTLIYMPLTTVLEQDLESRFFLIVARPLGTLLLVAGAAYILASTMTEAIKRAGQAEMIAKLEHELLEQRQEVDGDIQQLLKTHVEIANGNLNARAPLAQDSVLWQIARALNTLLVRFQRASQAEQELHRMEQAIDHSVNSIQQADAYQQKPVLQFTRTPLDRIIVALQGHTFGHTSVPQSEKPHFDQRR